MTRQSIGDPYSLLKLDLLIAPIWVRIFSACAELCPPENGSTFWQLKAAGSRYIPTIYPLLGSAFLFKATLSAIFFVLVIFNHYFFKHVQ